ncbi:MAG: acyl-CoA dehydrogenase family protein [Neisseria sp.]|nr:acyl-CoA dehydrogenase family protein [Neisseria sp.]
MSTTQSALLHAVQAHVQSTLRPLVDAIDREKLYPESYLRELGALGGFAASGAKEYGGLGLGLATQIAVIREVGRECGSTAFMVWCQAACAWYLLQSHNPKVRARYLADVLQGKVLAGTGMSNTVKHLAGIEKHFLRAKRTENGYAVSGGLPWVSNLGDNHVFAATALTEDGQYVMFMLRCDAEGLSLKPCAEFCALEGTRTLSVACREVQVHDDDVLAQPNEFQAFIHRIKAGFILLQIGIGAGIIDDCIRLAEDSNKTNGAVNAFLDDAPQELQQQLNDAWHATERLANAADAGVHELLPVLELRAAAAELTLAAAQSAALHTGARGYLMHHAAQRRTREALFVAIVTPALKHLRKEIAALQAERVAA